MKKNTGGKKLGLTREAVRLLSARDIAPVAGGALTQTTKNCESKVSCPLVGCSG